jgi:hypothetical protein
MHRNNKWCIHMNIINPATSVYIDKKGRVSVSKTFPPLDSVTRPTVDTSTAAYYLNRRAQTLRGWACHEDGPIRPIRIFGRLAWSVAEIRRLLRVA